MAEEPGSRAVYMEVGRAKSSPMTSRIGSSSPVEASRATGIQGPRPRARGWQQFVSTHRKGHGICEGA